MNHHLCKTYYGIEILIISIITGLVFIAEIIVTPILLILSIMAFGDDPTRTSHPITLNTWWLWIILVCYILYPVIYIVGLSACIHHWKNKNPIEARKSIHIPGYFLLVFIVYLLFLSAFNYIGKL